MLEIVEYEEKYSVRWDKFVLNSSINGTFLQTRRFLDYHPIGRFEDASFLIMQGSNIVAVIPACVVSNDRGKHLYSHKGSTFGGIVLDRMKYDISTFEEIYPLINRFFESKRYQTVSLSMSSDIFSEQRMDLFDYYFYKDGWSVQNEVSCYIDLEKSPDDLSSIMSVSRRRHYKHSLVNGLVFNELKSREELEEFYDILSRNLLKYDAKPVHTLEELLEFKNDRLSNETSFWGVYSNERMLLAGAMLFGFKKDVYHTQYLAQNPDTIGSRLYPMEFLDGNLIRKARELGYSKFSFGTSTLDSGKYLNVSLALFKEGFGCDYCNNKTYYKVYN